MNVKFSVKDVKVKLPSLDVNVNIGEIKYEIENANVLEIAQATRELLKGVAEFKADIEESERVDHTFYHNNLEKESPLVSFPFTGFVPKHKHEDSDSVPELDETFEKKAEDIKE